jgi:hypothetical protein
MTEQKRGRGRPSVYSPLERKTFAELVRTHGLTGAQAVLQARNGVVGVSKDEQAKAALRREAGFPKPYKTISLPMLSRYATAEGVALQRGRRKAA